MDLPQENENSTSLAQQLFSEQIFLANFVMGTYLGPDVKSDNPRCSASQKLAEGSLQYAVSDLGPSYVSMHLLEKLYYYVLRNAPHNLILRQNMLHKYLIGSLISPCLEHNAGCWQFINFFPLNLHKQIWYPASFRIVKGIIVIDNPVVSYVEDEDLEKFKSLSGLYDIKIDMDEFLHYKHEFRDYKDTRCHCLDDNEETLAGQTLNVNNNSFEKSYHKFKWRCQYEPLPTPQFSQFSPATKHYKKEGIFQRTCQPDGPSSLTPASTPNDEECIMDASIILSGTARKGIIGPPVGVVDIGVCRVAYYFRVALPGVRKDYCMHLSFPRLFSPC